jgi:hypothetical protein
MVQKTVERNDAGAGFPIFIGGDLDNPRIRSWIVASCTKFCVLLNSDAIVQEILDSYAGCKNINYLEYKNKARLYHQLEVDFPRMKLHVNSVVSLGIDHFINAIEKYNKYSYQYYNVFYLVMMLCTQATFYYPFTILNNLYSLPDQGMHILPADDWPYVNVVENNNHISIILKKTFRLFDINAKKVMIRYHIFMIITIDLLSEPDGYIFYGSKYGQCRDAVFHIIAEPPALSKN